MLYKLASKYGLVISMLAIGVVAFYWFEARPMKIRQDCSLIKETLLMQDEQNTKTSIYDTASNFSERVSSFIASSSEETNIKITKQFKLPKNAIPTNECWRLATNDQYTNCIHRSGLAK